MELELTIYIHSDETEVLKESGIPYSVRICDRRLQTFYNIDTIMPYTEDPEGDEPGYECSQIVVGGESFYSPLKYDQLKNLISNARAKR